MRSIPISALEHYVYCARQCSLIHVERTYEENLFTIRGMRAHERVTSEVDTVEAGVRVLRSPPLHSEELGLHGKADVVEIRPTGPYPIEYKVGKRRSRAAEVQLCAQGMCLEEMYETEIPEGSVFYVGSRRRVAVRFDETLRQRTANAVEGVRRMLVEATVPDAPNDSRCPPCSLFDTCMPGVVSRSRRMAGFQSALFRPLAAGGSDA